MFTGVARREQTFQGWKRPQQRRALAEQQQLLGEAVKKLGYPVTIIPLQKSFLNVLHRVKDLNLDVLVDLWNLIFKTPELDWLLLTKRPQNIAKMLPSLWVQGGYFQNVWLGTTAEDDEHYKQRWNVLSRIPAAVHFISHEPALGPLGNLRARPSGKFPDWIIMGGESGSGARMMERQWAADMRDACEVAGIAFFMKQMTGKKPIPADLMVREFPKPRLHAAAA